MESSPHIYFSQVTWSALNPLVSKMELFAQGTPISASCEDGGQTLSQGPCGPTWPSLADNIPSFHLSSARLNFPCSRLTGFPIVSPEQHTFPASGPLHMSSLCLVSPTPNSVPGGLLHASFTTLLHRTPLSLNPYHLCDYIFIYLVTCLLLYLAHPLDLHFWAARTVHNSPARTHPG